VIFCRFYLARESTLLRGSISLDCSSFVDIDNNACTGVTACDPIRAEVRIANRSCNGGDVRFNSWYVSLYLRE